jgi:diguanylate cyclase (GGDEF)-like protein/PAS domain S-box-containing protein
MLLRSIRTRMLGLVVATAVPFIALIGIGLWNQWRNDHAAAIWLARDEARLLAAQVDEHIGNLDNLMTGLSRAVSWNPADIAANDALLRRVKPELPSFVGNIMVFDLEGNNIGYSAGPEAERPYAATRNYFEKVLAGERLAIGDVAIARALNQWVVSVGRAVHDDTGRVRAVIATGTLLEHFQDALRVKGQLPGSVVQIVNQDGIVVARNVDGPNWVGRDLSSNADIMRHVAAQDISEVTRWADNVDRITGSARAHLVPWVVSVGLPTEVAFTRVIRRLGWSALFTCAALVISFAIAWTLSGRIVGPLRQLRKDASALATGELSHRTAVRTHDEVGILADTLNKMAESLEQRRADLRQTKEMLAAVIDASPVAIVCSDPQRRIFLWNRAAEQIFGYTAEEALSQPINLTPPGGEQESQSMFERTMRGEVIRDVYLKRMRKDGSLVELRGASARIYNPDGSVRGIARAYEDISDRRRVEEQLQRVAHYDQLTGLPNRLSLQKQLGRLLSGGGPKEPTAIVLFDLDGFKDVNDTLGHSTGDLLLIEVGSRLSDVVGSRGQVSRLGGDEFTVVIPGCGDPLEVGRIVDAALQRLAEPYEINDQILHLAGSAGSAIAPNDGANVDELIANADLALYQAKSDGGRACRFFLPVMRAQAQARHSLGLELRRAHDSNEFELYYQPQIRLADEAVVGAEALIRWRHPERGILAPGLFIDTLAASSIAPAVSRWIVETACAATAKWRADGLPLGRIGVNLFPNQLGDVTLLADIDRVLEMTGLPAEALELEITENVALNFEDAEVLQKLRDKGLMLAFDDFGTGYASLSYLTRFPLARIKIDRSFVAKITDDAGDAAIVRSLIAMAHNLGLEVIAEGVETEAQAEFLLKEQCQEAQGFLYGRPMPASEFEAFLRSRRVAGLERRSGKRARHMPRFQQRVGKTGRRHYS